MMEIYWENSKGQKFYVSLSGSYSTRGAPVDEHGPKMPTDGIE
jgi:hypothetical protein